MSDEIAVGVPMFSRVGALRQLLESVPEYVQTVYIADNGFDQDRRLYRESWPFELEALHLDHDIGIGGCRAALTDAVDEPYLWMGDNDMEFIRDDDLRQLRSILEAHDDLGGVSGWLIEGDVVRSGARDLMIHGDTLIRAGQTPEMVGEPHPHARFDFVPQAGLFRTAIYDTYDYDARLRTIEHVDFLLGHHEAAEWAFASTPVVQVSHHKDIDTAYRATRGGYDESDTDRFARKWGLKETVPGEASEWAQLSDRTIAEEAFGVFRSATPPRVWVPVRRVLNRVVG